MCMLPLAMRAVLLCCIVCLGLGLTPTAAHAASHAAPPIQTLNIGSCQATDFAVVVQGSGDVLVACGANGVVLAPPISGGQPRTVLSPGQCSYASAVVAGDYNLVYAACGSSGLVLFNFSDPTMLPQALLSGAQCPYVSSVWNADAGTVMAGCGSAGVLESGVDAPGNPTIVNQALTFAQAPALSDFEFDQQPTDGDYIGHFTDSVLGVFNYLSNDGTIEMILNATECPRAAAVVQGSIREYVACSGLRPGRPRDSWALSMRSACIPSCRRSCAAAPQDCWCTTTLPYETALLSCYNNARPTDAAVLLVAISEQQSTQLASQADCSAPGKISYSELRVEPERLDHAQHPDAGHHQPDQLRRAWRRP